MKSRILLGVSAAFLPAMLSAQAGTAPAAASAAAPAEVARPTTDAEREKFLLEATVIKKKGAPGGVTASYRATLQLGDVVHQAHIQTHDEYKSQLALGSGLELDFRDTWRNNVAAYRIDRILGLGMIPVTVVRREPDSGKMASFTWWVDDVLMEEKDRYEKKIKAPDYEAWNRQIYIVRIFDQLIYNFDRNLGNLLIDKGWNVWMIDHTRAFKIFKELRSEKNLNDSCEADLLVRLRTLEKPALQEIMRDLLNEGQIDGLLARRDKIVKIYEQRIAAKGEAQVLYHLPSRMVTAARPAGQ